MITPTGLMINDAVHLSVEDMFVATPCLSSLAILLSQPMPFRFVNAIMFLRNLLLFLPLARKLQASPNFTVTISTTSVFLEVDVPTSTPGPDTITTTRNLFDITVTDSPEMTTSALSPNLNPNHLQTCLELDGGVQADNTTILPGCRGMLHHVESCYNAGIPWYDPYNQLQSSQFQACLCQTSQQQPFTANSALWQNFSGCSQCMLEAGVQFSQLAVELDRVDNFCRAEVPVAYLFIRRIQVWASGLYPTNFNMNPAFFTGAMTLVFSLETLFTATPPLANLAWGASAPNGGSLQGLTPSLTTATFSVGAQGFTATSLVTWLHTATTTGGDPAAASASEAGAISSALNSALKSVASPTPSSTERCLFGCSGAPSIIFSARRLLALVVFSAFVVGVVVI